MSTVNVSRRNFLKSSTIVGGGLVMGFSLTGCGGTRLLPVEAIEGAYTANAFIQITPENLVRFYCPRDEMGQGVTTGLGTTIAEELDVNPQSLDIVFAGVHSDYKNPAFGVQGTGGSTAMGAHYYPLRQAGAAVRDLILQAASQDLGIEKSQLSTDDSYVIANGQRLPYSQFIATAQTLTAPDLETVQLKDKADFKYIGKEAPRLDGMQKATGTAVFGIDVDLPNMYHAVVRRSPVPDAALLSFDKSAVESMPGVTDILEISGGVAVVAEKYWQAKQAAEKLKVEWSEVELSSIDQAQIKADFKEAMDKEDGPKTGELGDLDAGFESASSVVESEYWAPYLAHAAMEPMNAVIRIENGQVDLWSGTQGPIGAEGLVARTTGIDSENIRIHTTYLGGGFGRRGTLTHIQEVAEIAHLTDKKTVQLVWSREDDIRNGFYRPASLMKIKAGVDDKGEITAWQAKRVGGNITPETLENILPAMIPGMPQALINAAVGASNMVFNNWSVDHSSIEGLYEDYYVPNQEVSHVTVDHGVPLTFLRSVGHSYTAFAKESMMDELAEKAGVDPVQFRLQHAKENPRLNGVIKVAGELIKQMKPAAGHHLGMAAHHSFESSVAQIAEVSVEGGRISVHKMTCIVDCGLAVTPDVVKAQMESSIMYGLTAVLHGELNVDGGAIKESNFHDYPILRMNEAPEVEVVIIDSDQDPTGVGEPGMPPVAPAVANAVYAATGQRLRSLPLKLTS